MEVRIIKSGERKILDLNGESIGEVKDYELKNSANGKTEFMLSIELEAFTFELLAKSL